MRLRNKKIVVFWVVLVFFTTTSSVFADVELHPGFITGTLTVTDLVLGEELIGGTVDAFSLTADFDGHDYNVPGGNYLVTVEGGYDYKVFSEALIKADYSSYWYQSAVAIGRKDTYVEIDETVDNFNFELVPGRIAPNVTVIGGIGIQRMGFYVSTDFELPETEIYTATHNIYGRTVFLNGDESTFPMRPGVTNDTNGDGDYGDEGDTYVMIHGWVVIDDIQYNLPKRYIDVIKSETTVVEWSLDVSSSIYGNVVVQGEPMSYYQLLGGTWIDGEYVYFSRIIRPASVGHDINLPPSTWGVRPTAYWRYGTRIYSILSIPSKSETLGTGERKEVSWNINPGIVTGSIDLFGAYGNLDQIEVNGGGGPKYANAHNITNDYRLILYGGEWRIGYPYTILNFLYDTPGMKSELLITDYGTPYTSIDAGTEVSGVDLSYDTATITVYYRVELPGGWGELRSPYLIATASEGTGSERIDSRAKGWGTNELTTLGECTITVLAGTYNIEAYATVEGSYTKFGEFTITVEPGDVIRHDIEAPTVHVSQPGGSEHVCGSSVEVIGTVTDESQVGSITVSGVAVEFFPTDNPDDEKEVSFSTIVGDLVVNEWNIITIVITDTLGNSITVERQVFRDPCNVPPVIESISGPVEPVAMGADYEMTGIFTDPDDGDTHTAMWDWGDGTTSGGTVDQTNDIVTGFHEYVIPGVYTVTLTVVDSFDESDTATWSQFIVIYDPSAGFVTGGGWINSPAGAYFADPDLNGKANFGFVAKYKKGSTVPIGNTEFQFQVGDLNFHSDTYQWLVIAGARAKFKGSGTINGEGSYKFMLTAVDGELVSSGGVDKFRLKIWVEDEATGEEIIIYDNMLGVEDDAELGETTEIGGGSIMIHKKPK